MHGYFKLASHIHIQTLRTSSHFPFYLDFLTHHFNFIVVHIYVYHNGFIYICMCDIEQIIQKIVIIDGKKLVKLILGAARLSNITIQKLILTVCTYKESVTLRKVIDTMISHASYTTHEFLLIHT